MIENYIPRKLLEKEKYYRFEGEYFLSILEESPLGIYDLIKKGNKKIILLGDAGYGKSTELKNVFSKFAEEENPDFVPIFIDLSTYSDEDMKEYIKHKIGEDSLDLLNIDTSKLVFLFDEFDQVPDKGKAERKIKNFIEKYNMSTFIITSRTNFYSGQFEGFNVFVLLPLSSNDVQKYARILLKNLCDSFIEELHQKSIFDLAKNPFFLQRIIKIYQADKIIPSSRASIFDRIISLALEQDVVKLRNKYDLGRTYPFSEIEKDLMYLSLIMETLQRNFISVEVFNQVINDDKKREVISELNLIKKSFFKEGDVYQFQHNNFQEYLSAKMIANKDFDKVLNFISFEKRLPLLDRFIALLRKYIEVKPYGIKVEEVISAVFQKSKRINKIKPSWVNTISFLCQLRHEDDLLEYLMKNEPELCLNFEVSRIDEKKRAKIFKIIFKKYTKRKIWLDRERIDYEEMAHFAKTKETYNYLMDFACSKEHFVYRHNAILLLGMMKEFADNTLHDLLIQYATDENENSNVRCKCLYALAQLGKTDMETIDKLIHLKNSSNEMVLSGFYYLIKESDHIDSYVDTLLGGIHKTRETTLSDVRWNLKEGIKKVTSANGLRKIIKYFIENPDVLRDYDINKSIEEIIKNTIKAYETDNTLCAEMKKLTVIIEKEYMDEVIPSVVRFFRDTGTTFHLFKEFSDEGLKSHYSLLASIADERCINFLIEKYQKGEITEDNIQIFVNFLVRRNRDFDSLLKMITQKTGKFHLPPPRDYLKEQKEELQRKIQIIFDKNEFLKEVEKIFDSECKKELNYEELKHILLYRWKEQEKEKYNDFVINELQKYFMLDVNKKWALDSLKEEINKWDYGWFTISHIFDLLYHGTNVELSKEQIALIKEYCLNNLQKINFKNALKQKDRTTTANTIAVILWYFLRKFALDYPKEILLDMLSFDWFETNGYVGIDYLIERLPQGDVKSRIIKNLKEGISVNQVLNNHISYCKKYHVLEAKELIQRIVENKNIETEDRLLALDTIITLDGSIEFLEKLLNTDEQKIFIEVAKILLSRGNKKCRKKLLENLNFNKGDLALDSAKLLIEEQNIKAIKFYADFIKRTKEFEAESRGESLLGLISTTKVLPILFKLLKFSYEYKGDIKQDDFFSLSNAIFGVLRKIALQSFSNFNKVSRNLHKFIRRYDSKFEGVNFLHVVCDNIEKAFFANYPSRLTIDEAKRKVDDFLMARTHEAK